MDKQTEYNNINEIGGSFRDWHDNTEKLMMQYYHKCEFETVKKLCKIISYNEIVDLGCGEGAWYNFYKSIGFQKLIGIDISEVRLKKAKETGYDETYCGNGYKMPFNDDSINCIICNNVLLHVLQNEDRIKIFKEVKRVLKKSGIFIFNFPTKKGNPKSSKRYFKTTDVIEIQNLLGKSDLSLIKKIPCYFASPRIGANPKFVKMSTSIVFPITDSIFSKLLDINKAKVVYFSVQK